MFFAILHTVSLYRNMNFFSQLVSEYLQLWIFLISHCSSALWGVSHIQVFVRRLHYFWVINSLWGESEGHFVHDFFKALKHSQPALQRSCISTDNKKAALLPRSPRTTLSTLSPNLLISSKQERRCCHYPCAAPTRLQRRVCVSTASQLLCAIVILPATVKGREPATSIGHFRWLGLPCPETSGAPCPSSSSTTIREGASERVSQSDASVPPPGRWQTRLAVLWTVPSLAPEHSPSPACHMTSPARDRADLCSWYCPWQKPDARFQGANQGAVPPDLLHLALDDGVPGRLMRRLPPSLVGTASGWTHPKIC